MVQRAGHTSACPGTGGTLVPPWVAASCTAPQATPVVLFGVILCYHTTKRLLWLCPVETGGKGRLGYARGVLLPTRAGRCKVLVQPCCAGAPRLIKVSAQLLGCCRERSLPLHLFCLLSSFCDHLWSLDRAGTHTESFPLFLAVWMKAVSAP